MEGDATGLAVCCVLFAVLIGMLLGVEWRTKFRPWRLESTIVADAYVSSLCKEGKEVGLRRYYGCVQFYKALYYIGCALVLVLAALIGWLVYEYVNIMGYQVSQALAFYFICLYGLCLARIALIWGNNSWSLIPLLHPQSFESLLQEEAKAANSVKTNHPSYQPERRLRLEMSVLLFLAIAFFTSANVMFTPYIDTDEDGKNATNMTTTDETWHVAGNWVFITINTLLVIMSVYCADCYIHSGVDLLVEMQARAAEMHMRYGVMTSRNTIDSNKTTNHRIQEMDSPEVDDMASLAKSLDVGHDVNIENGDEKRRQGEPPANDNNEEFVALKIEDNENEQTNGIRRRRSSTSSNRIATTKKSDVHPATRLAYPEIELDLEKLHSSIHHSSHNLTKVALESFQKRMGRRNSLHGHAFVDGLGQGYGKDDTILEEGNDANNVSSLESNEELEHGDKALEGLELNGNTQKRKRDRLKLSSTDTSGGGATISDSINLSPEQMDRIIEIYNQRVGLGFVALYLSSVLVLLIHSISYYCMTGYGIGFTQSIAVLMLDTILFIELSRSTNRKSKVRGVTLPVIARAMRAWEVCIILVLARTVLISVPSNAWFIGHSLMYAMTGAYLVYLALSHHFNVESYASRSSSAAATAAAAAQFRRSSAMSISSGENVVSRGVNRNGVVDSTGASVRHVSRVAYNQPSIVEISKHALRGFFSRFGKNMSGVVLHDAQQRLTSSSPRHSDRWRCSYLLPKLRGRDLSLLFFTIYFVIITALLSVDSERPLLPPMMTVQWFKDDIAQWKFGVLALLFVANFGFAYSMFLAWKGYRRRRSRKHRRRQLGLQSFDSPGPYSSRCGKFSAWVSTTCRDLSTTNLFGIMIIIAAIGAAIGSAYFVDYNLLKNSDVRLMGTVALLYPTVIASFAAYDAWTTVDFIYILPLPPPYEEWLERERAAGKRFTSAMLARSKYRIDKVRRHLKRRNAAMIGASVWFFVAHILWGGVVLNLEVGAEQWVCFVLPASSMAIWTGLLAAQLWFNTLTVDRTLLVLILTFIINVLVSFIFAIYALVTTKIERENALQVTTFMVLLLDALLVGMVAIAKWRDDNFRMSALVGVAMALCASILCGVGAWIWMKYGAAAGITYFTVFAIAVLLLSLWIWFHSSSFTTLESMGRSVRFTIFGTILLLVSLFLVLAIMEWVTETDQLGPHRDPLHGFTYFLVGYGLVLLFGIVYVLIRYQSFRRSSTMLCPSPVPFGFPVISYKIEHRGGELSTANFEPIFVLWLLLSFQLVGVIISGFVEANAGVAITSLSLCLVAINAVEMSLRRYSRFRNYISDLDRYVGLEQAFEIAQKEAVDRCLQISQQAMMGIWLKEKLASFPLLSRSSTRSSGSLHRYHSKPSAKRPSDSGEDSDMINITTVEGLKSYHKRNIEEDEMYDQYVRDSVHYRALFHILFLMRAKQLLVTHRAARSSKTTTADSWSSGGSGNVGKRKMAHPRPRDLTNVKKDRVKDQDQEHVNKEAKNNRADQAIQQPNDEHLEEGETEEGGMDKHKGLTRLEDTRKKAKSERLKGVPALASRETEESTGTASQEEEGYLQHRSVTSATKRLQSHVTGPVLLQLGPHRFDATLHETGSARVSMETVKHKLSVARFLYETTRQPWSDPDFPPTNGSLYIDWDDEDEYLAEIQADEDLSGAVWCRPHDFTHKLIGPSPQLVPPNGIFDPSEVIQGEIGNCWLLSAISVVALRPELMNHILQDRTIRKEGIYHIRLFLDGEWSNVLVDDQFPCFLDKSCRVILPVPRSSKAPWYTICDDPPDVVTRKRLIEKGKAPEDCMEEKVIRLPLPQCSRSRNLNVFWAMLIEKAYAKYLGCYEALDGGHVHTALVDLTGGFAQLFSLQDDIEMTMSGALWQKLMDYAKKGSLLAAGSPAKDKDGNDAVEDGAMSQDMNGIVHGHAYSILRVVEEHDYNGRHQLLQLRDPWGIAEWRGPWSKRDTKRWSRRMQKRLGYKCQVSNSDTTPRALSKWMSRKALSRNSFDLTESLPELAVNRTKSEILFNKQNESNGEDDGSFWISLDDFIANFKWLYVCQLFDPNRWKQKSVKGKWLGQSAGGPPNQPNAKFNPQFSLMLSSERTDGGSVSVFISITNIASGAELHGRQSDEEEYCFGDDDFDEEDYGSECEEEEEEEEEHLHHDLVVDDATTHLRSDIGHLLRPSRKSQRSLASEDMARHRNSLHSSTAGRIHSRFGTSPLPQGSPAAAPPPLLPQDSFRRLRHHESGIQARKKRMYSNRKYPYMSLQLLDLGGKPLDEELFMSQVIATTGNYKDTRELSMETKLPCNKDRTYTLFPSLYPAGEEGEFRINVYCEVEFELHPFPSLTTE